MNVIGIIILSWGFLILFIGGTSIYRSNEEIDAEIRSALKNGDALDRLSLHQETFGGPWTSRIPSMLLFCISVAIYLSLCIFPINLQTNKSVAIPLLIISFICQYPFIWSHIYAKSLYISNKKKPWWFTKVEFIRIGHAPRILIIFLIPMSFILHLIILLKIAIV